MTAEEAAQFGAKVAQEWFDLKGSASSARSFVGYVSCRAPQEVIRPFYETAFAIYKLRESEVRGSDRLNIDSSGNFFITVPFQV